jgi:hypothetical protein
MSVDRLNNAKETSKNWLLLNDYPKDFHAFFFQWTLLNLFYNELSQERSEMQRVLEFGRKYENLFDLVKNAASDLMREECVGDGKNDQAPSSPIKIASLKLRTTLGIKQYDVCVKCRSSKRRACLTIRTKPYGYGNFEALMTILYQIRCNLFHGDKTEYRNGFQAQRNILLVSIGNRILEQTLFSISSGKKS